METATIIALCLLVISEVLPYTPDAWIKEGATKIGYEVSFTRHFYKPQPLRSWTPADSESASAWTTSRCAPSASRAGTWSTTRTG
jgi:hypothetical protein